MIKENSLSNKLLLYLNTIKYLRPIQIWGQILFRLYQPRVEIFQVPKLRQITKFLTNPIGKNISCSNDTLQFLNKAYSISRSDIWNRTDVDKLWLYNLHYFDILKNSSHFEQQLIFIKRWIDENPPAHGNGWEPYTLSLRIVNWVKWLLIHSINKEEISSSLAIQANFLSKRLEIHILGNHLLANAKALLFAGLFFSGRKAERWFKIGMRYFSQELRSQILSDGGHCELSPMYHSIILEDLLDVINIFQVYNRSIPYEWIMIAKKMFTWLKSMEHPDGRIAFFNDSVFGIASSSQELQSYAKRLNIIFDDKTNNYLQSSGYIRLMNRYTVLIADVGDIGADYQPGHAHADTFSFELSIKQKRLFVNSGISTYNHCYDRFQQRSTHSHNSLTVNDKNSSHVWKSFRVAERAKVKNIQFSEDSNKMIVRASHDGYFKHYGIIHTRRWTLQEDRLIISDKVEGKGKHKISIYFHVHPDVTILHSDDNSSTVGATNLLPQGRSETLNPEIGGHTIHDSNISLLDEEHTLVGSAIKIGSNVQFLDRHGDLIAKMKTRHALNLSSSTYHPEFNISLANQKLVIQEVCLLPIEFENTIYWND